MIIEQHPSPNHSSRGGARITLLAWHATAGSYASALRELCDPKPDRPDDRVSAHYLIAKTGHIVQLVPDSLAAWHAGASHWLGMDSVQIQHCSLGIELENANDGHDPYPPTQLASAHWLGQSLIARYNIERADVVRHRDIAPGRKFDPMPPAFLWPLFADSLYMDAPLPVVDRRYRVKLAATGGATIRATPSTKGAMLGRLHAGADWYGLPEAGAPTYVKGFGSSNVWIASLDRRFVWSGLLETV